VQQSDEESEKPGSSQAIDLVSVKVIETHGKSVVVEFEQDGMPYRSYVDPTDIEDDKCDLERLRDAPCSITWNFDFSDLARDAELELKKHGIWTYEDLQQKDRVIIRIATNLLGQRIWDAAKRGSNRRL